MSQNKIFLSSEGDAWFNRNVPHLMNIEQAELSEDVRFICDSLNPYQLQINQVLEIGCSNGIKLEAICSKLNATGVGIDPSTAAVEAGNNRQKHTNINLHVGTGTNLPFESTHFDLVFFAFCLYLFDRSSLLTALAEADRVLKPGGFMAITDFDPGSQYKRPYSHLEGLFSYKQDYSNFYCQTGLYYLSGKHCFSHRRAHFDESPDERVSTALLYKELNPYPTRP